MNSITIIGNDKNATVFGSLAMKVWDYGRGNFPRMQAAQNKHFVIEPIGGKNVLRAAQPSLCGAMRYMNDRCVLVSIEA
jgi:hypothetical protein